MIYGIVLDAGNQTRFDSKEPKSLQQIKGRPILDRNLDILKQVCDDYYIVINEEKLEYFDKYAEHLRVINSGRGSGDALLEIYQQTSFNKDDIIVLIWGDSLHTSLVPFNRGLASLDRADFIVPVYKEKSPYVRFVPGKDSSISEILFSKYTGPNEHGYHDQSCFFFKVGLVIECLLQIRFDYYDYHKKRYLIPNRQDFDLLEIFNLTDKPPSSFLFEVKKTEKSHSFNTVEELEFIEDKV